MKVLQINIVCGILSTGRIATDLRDILISNGHSCKIAYGSLTPKNISLNDCIKIGTKFDLYTHIALSRITDKAGFYSKLATAKLIKQIKQYDPDIIHLHNIHGYYINIKMLFEYLAESNKKVVWTLHDCWSFTGHCAHFDLINCTKWKTGCFACPQKNTYPSSYLFDNSKKNYEKKKSLFTNVKNMTIVTPSAWLANLAKQSFLNKYPIKVINNGINLSSFKPSPSDFKEKYNICGKHIVLGVASSWSEKKGLNDFAKLSSMLGENYKIILVGVSDTQKELLPKNIICIPKTNSIKELAEIYTAADVFVNLSYEDVFSTVNLEALACGTPVITYKSGGNPECINETCGIAVSRGDLDAAKEKIIKISNAQTFTVSDCTARALRFDKNEKYIQYITEIYK